MTDGESDASVRTGTATDAESDGHSSFPPCPHCDSQVITVTTRGPMTHVAGPCGWRFTPHEARQL
ncbi:hypothetical protein [Natrinema sp. J7-1]|uniref:hypothetical protein n=1 Tax=Natrinema sp. J7-1 TaxID=1172566 RepID=UPI0006777F03|nr:hypothetical protein [Natrinema sp. J7-1]